MPDKHDAGAREPGYYWVRLINPPWQPKFVGDWIVAEWTEHDSWMLFGYEEGETDGPHFLVGPRITAPARDGGAE